MFFYDWAKIYDASKGNVVEIVRIFRMIVEKQVPKNKYDPIYRYSQKDFSGISFMLHPDVLLHHSCLLYTSPSPRDRQKSRMPSSA